MLHTRLGTAGADREIYPRIIQHPLGVIVLAHTWGRIEQGGVEVDRALKIIHSDMDMQAFHGTSFRMTC